MNEQEKIAFEMELRNKIEEEQRAKERARKAKWREKNRKHIREYNKVYRIRRKLCKGVEHDGE